MKEKTENRVIRVTLRFTESEFGKIQGKQADVLMNIIGNVISGQVSGETAKHLSERFGKIKQ